jgi:hypothetical protein
VRPKSLKEAVDHIIGSENWMDAISEFLDEFYSCGPSERQRMIRRGAPAHGRGVP